MGKKVRIIDENSRWCGIVHNFSGGLGYAETYQHNTTLTETGHFSSFRFHFCHHQQICLKAGRFYTLLCCVFCSPFSHFTFHIHIFFVPRGMENLWVIVKAEWNWEKKGDKTRNDENLSIKLWLESTWVYSVKNLRAVSEHFAGLWRAF